jgi:hypothetical protein
MAKSHPHGSKSAGEKTGEKDWVQCPNCCRLARVTSRSMGLLFYQCELCLTTGATPDPANTSDRDA